jgi:hypothetical protein
MPSKFKVGDKVRVIRCTPSCRRLLNKIGVIDVSLPPYAHVIFGAPGDKDYSMAVFAFDEVELVIPNALQRLKKRYAIKISD